MAAAATPTAQPAPPRVLIVSAAFYTHIADHLCAGAKARLAEADAAVEELKVPGALEIAAAIRFAARSGQFDGFVALGCVIRGETTHYELVCNESARGLTLLAHDHGLAIGNGVLTVESEDQALDRADPARKNKGADAATACLRLIEIARRFAPQRPSGDQDPILLA